MLRYITQKEAIELLSKTRYPRKGGDFRYFLRFMLMLNYFAKKKGYRLFNWTDYMLRESEMDIAGSWVLSNIEELSKEMSVKRKN